MFKIPEGHTEEEIFAIVCDVVSRFTAKWKFRGHDEDDIQQQSYLIVSKSLEKYDPAKGCVENFICNDLSRKLINFKRDKYVRPNTKTDNKKRINEAINIGIMNTDTEIGLSYRDKNEFRLDFEFLVEKLRERLKKESIHSLNRWLDGAKMATYRKTALIEEIKNVIAAHEDLADFLDDEIFTRGR